MKGLFLLTRLAHTEWLVLTGAVGRAFGGGQKAGQ